MEINYHLYAEKEALLAHGVGEAVSRWARLEYFLMSTFAIATGLKQRTSAAIFSQVKAFSLMLDITDIAVKSVFLELEEQTGSKPKEEVFWNSLVAYMRELSGDRNYMAHTSIVAHGEGDPEDADWAQAVPKIGPSPAAVFGGDERFLPMEVAEVRQLILDMQQALEALVEFNQELAAHATSQPKYYAPIARRRPPRKQRQEASRKSPQPPR